MSRPSKTVVISLLLAICILGAACGQGQVATTPSPVEMPTSTPELTSPVEVPTSTPEPTTQTQPVNTMLPPLSIGIYVDPAFGDRAYFDIALDAIPILRQKYNTTVHLYEGRGNSDNYGPLFDQAAAKDKIVFVLEFELMDAMIKASAKYPNVLFVNMSQSGVKDPNSVYNDFKDYEGTFVAGALAALTTTHTEMKNINSQKVIGFVGGADIPVIKQGLDGYMQGARYIDPEVKVESVMVGDFNDPVKGKEANLALIAKGADIVIEYAGLTGEGGFNAAKEGSPMYAIGAGPDQRFLAPNEVIGSVLKRVDNAIIDYVAKYQAGTFPQKGAYVSYGVADKGIELVMSEDLLPAEVVQRVKQVQDDVATGKIKVVDILAQPQ